MNVFSIVRVRCPSTVEPCPAASEIYSFTLINAPSTRPSLVVVALNPTPSPIFNPLRESRDPVLAIVFSPSFTTFLGALTLGIEDNTKIFSLRFLATTSISDCVSSVLVLLSVFLAFSKSILIAANVDAGALSLLIFSKSSSTFSILVCNFVLSNTCFSTIFSVLALLFTAGMFPLANSSFLAGFTSSFTGFTSSLPVVPSNFSTSTFFSTTSPALAIPAPKNILAPITTEAAPTLNFLIE